MDEMIRCLNVSFGQSEGVGDVSGTKYDERLDYSNHVLLFHALMAVGHMADSVDRLVSGMDKVMVSWGTMDGGKLSESPPD